jgi:hypothetical protein
MNRGAVLPQFISQVGYKSTTTVGFTGAIYSSWGLQTSKHIWGCHSVVVCQLVYKK